MPDILLTHGYFLWEDEKEQQIMKPYPPLGLLYISGYLRREGFAVEIYDSTFGSRAGIVMCRNDCQRLAPSTVAASLTSWSSDSSAASRTMNTNGVHCHVSPMITAARASHGSVTHVKSRRPIATHSGSSGPFDVSVIIRNM